MKVVCILIEASADAPRCAPGRDARALPPRPGRDALAEACLAFSPQVAAGHDAVFVEIEGSRHLFGESECIQRLHEMLEVLDLKGKVAVAPTVPAALAFARYEVREVDRLPVEALACFLHPFAPEPFPALEVFRKLGVATIGDFKKIPRAEIPSRFGKQGLLAYERLLEASRVAWPRWKPADQIEERVDFDFAAQIHTFEPVLFLLKTALQRVFLRLYARREKLAALRVTFHLNKLKGAAPRISDVNLPLPQTEVKGVTFLLAERLAKELEKTPLEDALEGLTLLVLDTAPFAEAQRDFFSKREEEGLAWAALVGRLTERLGEGKAFLSAPAPRLLPEASWGKTLDEAERGTLVTVPLRPLRLLDPPVRLQRSGDLLVSRDRRWRFTGFHGPEKLRGEWWLGGFEREYFHVETCEGETLWVFTAPVSDSSAAVAPRGLWLHGVFD